jgi:UDP-N-acetylmuramoylalanine--D-glutamate ligase
VNISDLCDKSVLILGLGVEGRSTLRFLRAAFPEKTLGLADQHPLGKLSAETRALIERDSHVRKHLGDGYLGSLAGYDVIIKSPGIPVNLPAYQKALAAGKQITSQAALFFANFPGTIVGVTGTKGKSTTASLLHAILKKSFPDAILAGNIGVPLLDVLGNREQGTGNREEEEAGKKIAVCELSSHQLEGLRQSPHVAVLLNIVPEHLDYYESFEQYVDAKENITRYQGAEDFLIYDADHELPRAIAARSKARRIGCSLTSSHDVPQTPGCVFNGDSLIWRSGAGDVENIVAACEVPLPGRFNLLNVAAAVAAAKVLQVPTALVAQAVRDFQPLALRLECVGTFAGVTYFNDPLATVPEAAIAALDTLGDAVDTVLLGGADRGIDFKSLAQRLLRSGVKTVILFPPSGERIWQAIREQSSATGALPQHFFVKSMEEAVEIARRETAAGKMCLHSPASPSFGMFRDYRERGEAFARLAKGGSKDTEGRTQP